MEIHHIKCLECGKTFPYKFSSERVKNWGAPSFENLKPGEIIGGIIPMIKCKGCGKEISVPNFKPAEE